MDGAHAILPALVARDDDADDVRWALQTAQARWQAGGHADALVWMRRAAQAATEAGNHQRAEELREDAEDLSEQVWFSDKSGRSSPPASLGREPPPIDIDIDVEEPAPASPIGGGTASARGQLASVDLELIEPLEPEEFESVESSPRSARESRVGLPEAAQAPLPRRASRGLIPAEPARQARVSSPAIEIEEVEFEEEELSVEDVESLLAQSERSVVPGSFNDRLSSVGVGPTNAEEALPHVDSDAESLSFSNSTSPPEESGEISAEEAGELAGLISDEVEFGEDVSDVTAQVAVKADSPPLVARPSSSRPPSRRPPPTSRPPKSSRRPPPASARPFARKRPSTLENMSASAAARASRAPTSPSIPSEANEAIVDGLALSEARGLEDVPTDVQARLASTAQLTELRRGEEVGFFGAALVTNGAVDILPAIADDAGAQARQGDVVFTTGTLNDSIALRVEAKIDGTRVAVWSPTEIAAALESCPWVEDELRFIADHFLAVCGATLGPLGERLDNALRGTVFSRMEVRTCEPGQVIVEAGSQLDGLYVIGGGRVEVMSGAEVDSELSPGSLLFPATILSAGAAPSQARAGSGGALLLYATRSDARELMMSIPPLLEILAS